MAVTISSKKVQVDKGKTTIFAVVSIASIAVVASLMISKGLWSQASYYGRVADKKEVAVTQLETNKAAITELKTAYDAFVAQSPNLISGNPNGTGEKDGNNAALVLDALPAKNDFPAVASSLEKLLFGYTINGMGGAGGSAMSPADPNAVAAAPAGGVTEMPFNFEVKTTYGGFAQMIDLFDKSIRPFYFTRIQLSGTNNDLDVEVEGKTFYQLESGLKITEEVVE